MVQKMVYRLGIVGASTLIGKELSDELGDSVLAAYDVVLLDADEAAGKMATAADEISFIQRISSTSFDGLDFVFFAGPAEVTKEQWQQARRAGASLVDLTGALAKETGVLTMAPWVSEVLKERSAAAGPDLNTPAVVPAHPAALMLALLTARIQTRLPIRSVAVTLLEPVSQHGSLAMDELHQQTVNLLSFHDLPREQYDTQIAFNLQTALGTEAKVRLDEVEGRVRSHYAAISGGVLPELALQVVQAPVFHGYTASVLIELDEPADLEELEGALAGEHVDVVGGDAELPSNLSAAGQRMISVSARGATRGERSTRFWLWVAADNLKLLAVNAIACAVELRRLRPLGKVQ
jgi:aspartate-semialdehyde dehydrogenase